MNELTGPDTMIADGRKPAAGADRVDHNAVARLLDAVIKH